MAAHYVSECVVAGPSADSDKSLRPAGVRAPEEVIPAKANHAFIRDVLKLVTGSASAQILTVLTAPFIARLFAPAAFGLAAVFVSITGVISALVGMRYELSVVLPEKDEEAANAMAVALGFILLTSSTTGLLLLAGGNYLLRWLHAPDLHKYLWLIPVMVLLNGFFAALSYWNTRKKKFARQTIAQVAGAAFFVVAQIAAGVSGHSSGGVIIFSTVLAVFVSAMILGLQTFSECWQLFLHNVRSQRMWAALKRYSNFPRYSTASAVLSNLGWQVPTFMLSGYFSSTVVGHYALGNKVLRIPVNLVGTNIATVFFQHASEVHHQGTLRVSVEKMFRYLIAIFLFPSLMLCLIGKELFMVAFGSRWAEAGIYTQILSIYVLFWFMAVPLGIALNVLEKQALELRLVIMILLTRVVALWIGGSLGSARLALALFSIVGVVVYGYFCLVVLRLCAVPVLETATYMARNALTFIPAALVIAVLKHLGAAPLVTLGIAIALLAAYYGHFIHTNSAGRELLAGMLRKFSPSEAS